MDMMDMSYTWDLRLVVLSYVVASVASFAALTLAGKVNHSEGSARWAWLSGGAFTMGIGVWAMHFVGMLALKMDMPMSYDLLLTALSVLAAIVASGIAFYTVSGESLGFLRLLTGGTVMGAGVATMHYMGMAAMRMPATISYNTTLFTISIVIAVVASVAAMLLFYYLNLEATEERFGTRFVDLAKGAAALVMGVAVIGMHYTGMFAARYTPTGDMTMGAQGSVDPMLLAVMVSTVAFVIVGVALVVTMAGRGLTIEDELEFAEETF